MISDKFHTDELEMDFLWKFYIFLKGVILFYLSCPDLLYRNSEGTQGHLVCELNPVFSDSK